MKEWRTKTAQHNGVVFSVAQINCRISNTRVIRGVRTPRIQTRSNLEGHSAFVDRIDLD